MAFLIIVLTESVCNNSVWLIWNFWVITTLYHDGKIGFSLVRNAFMSHGYVLTVNIVIKEKQINLDFQLEFLQLWIVVRQQSLKYQPILVWAIPVEKELIWSKLGNSFLKVCSRQSPAMYYCKSEVRKQKKNLSPDKTCTSITSKCSKRLWRFVK